MSAPESSSALAPLLARWRTLDKAKRTNALLFVSIAGGVALLLAAYYGTGEADKRAASRAPDAVTAIKLGDERLEDDIRAKLESQRKDDLALDQQQSKTIQETQAEAEAARSRLEILEKAVKMMAEGGPGTLPEMPGDAERGKSPVRDRAPQDPGAWANAPTRSGATLAATAPAPAPLPVTFAGEIGVASGSDPIASGGAQAAPSGAKKNSRTFFLPTGFMSARLLTGLNAKTVESAREDPEPMLLRVQAPAVLPNEVRAQLQGCFVIAHGYGSLASERVESRLVSLSCVDFEGRSVIEQAITGIVVDQDGVKGLSGRVVSKMGANLSRMFVAGLVEGAGDAAERSASTVATSALGQTQTLDTDKVGRAALGRGVSKGAGELTKIYADLVRQSAPVIEMGPGKDVTILVTEGVQLEVKDYASED